MTAGRPTIYSEEIITKTREYLELCQNSYEQLAVRLVPINDANPDIKKVVTWEVRLKVKLPSIEGLAVHLKISRETIRRWSNPEGDGADKPEFCGIIEELQAKQGEMLINMGITGEYNPTISKVLLSKHGYREESKIEGEGFVPTNITIVPHKPDDTTTADKA